VRLQRKVLSFLRHLCFVDLDDLWFLQVTVVETQGGTVVGSFTLMRSESVLLEKQSGHFIFAANAAVKGSKVGYTN